MIKRTKIFLFGVLIVVQSAFGQVDSSRLEFFPLHKGDLWQYFYGNYNSGEGYLKNATVVNDDTLLPNGLHYVMVTGSPYFNFIKFYRIDTLMRVQEYYSFFGDSCGGGINEANVFRLNEKDSVIWRICYNIGDQLFGKPYYFRCNGIFHTVAFGDVQDVMFFEAGGHTARSDTTFDVNSANFLLMRGVGLYFAEEGEADFVQLTAAIIDGKQYGKFQTAVKENGDIPRSFILEQNYPNPFNGTTLIRYTIPQREYVRLSVFDILGREISVLVNSQQEAGTHTAFFGASNQSSGAYFYRLMAGRNSLTRIMVVQK